MSALIPQEKSLEYLNNKFKFEYTPNALSVTQKLIEEDLYALSKLQSEETANSVREVGNRLADYLEQWLTPPYGGQFIYGLGCKLSSLVSDYPVPAVRPATFDTYLAMLRASADPVISLSMIWPVFSVVQGGARASAIDGIYHGVLQGTKDYTRDDDKKTLSLQAGGFGNSGTVQSELFSHDRFMPYARAVDYILPNENSPNTIFKKMFEENRPYVSGLSGMANMTCKVLDILQIHPFSPLGRNFCEAMGAFIVGSGMHSYYEVYKSFNFYAKAIAPQSSINNYSSFSDYLA